MSTQDVGNASLPQVGTEQITSVQPVQTQGQQAQAVNQESNPFDSVSIGKQLDGLLDESENKIQEQQTDLQNQEQQNLITDPELEKIIGDDPKFKEFDLLIEAGYSAEDAYSKAFGEAEPPTIEPNFVNPADQYKPIYEKIIQSPEDFQRMQKNAISPDLSDVHSYMKSYNLEPIEIMSVKDVENVLKNQGYELDEGTKSLVEFFTNALNQFNQHNNFFAQRALASESQFHLSNINQVAKDQHAKIQQFQQIASSLDAQIEKEIPEVLKEPKMQSIFQYLLQSELNKVPKNLQNNEKILQKVNKSIIEKFKKLQPKLASKFGLNQTNQQLASYQMAQMQNVSSSGLQTTGVDANFKIDPLNTKSVGNVLDKILS